MRRKQRHGNFRPNPNHGLPELRRSIERVPKDEPKPKRLDFSWMSVPKVSSLEDVLPGADVALKFCDGSTLAGHFVSETSLRVRFKPFGCGEAIFAKSEIIGARLVGAHTFSERQAVAKKQASAARFGFRELSSERVEAAADCST